MKKPQKMGRKGFIAVWMVILAAVAFSTFYLMQDRAMGTTQTEQAMGEMEGMSGMAGMEGMEMGTNETGQATTMLTAEKRERIGLRVVEVEEREVERMIRAVGRIAYDERKLARINLRVDGWVQDLFVNFTGQEVRKGEPLLTIYSPDLVSTQQEYLLAKRSQAKLKASPIADVREVGDTLVSSARKRLLLSGLTEKQIEEIEQRGEPQTAIMITSPVSGVVTKREGVKGMRVTPEMILYEIADLSIVWVIADLYEHDLSDIKKGEKADVTVAAYPGETFQGRVAFIDSFLNSQTRTVRIRLELPNPGVKLKPEMFAQVTLKVPLGKGLLIPESAVLDTGLRKIAFIDQGGEMFEPREIKARRIDGLYLVQEGLSAGDKIVISANFLIDSESKLMASSNMMGVLGMAGIKMEQAQMGKMDKMKGMPKQEKKGPGDPKETKEEKKGMEGMPGM
ncbi:MAG: efflux RND transporter periplasmic adaptor subunit [Candidatus Manganitrophaceae bacterium]